MQKPRSEPCVSAIVPTEKNFQEEKFLTSKLAFSAMPHAQNKKSAAWSTTAMTQCH
jgi:hypothetical protein